MDPEKRAHPRPDAWPKAIFDAPVLRGLDARAHRDITEAGRLLDPREGAAVYRAGDEGSSFFVVASGKIALHAVRRGDDHETLLRVAGPGESFGEESTVGIARRAAAIALERSTVAEIPVHVFRRAAARSGKADAADRMERALERSATRDLLGTLAFTRDLPARDVDVLLDAVTHRRLDRGEPAYRTGDPAAEVFLIADGMVQIQTEEDDRLHVRAYLTRGDFFGDAELTAARSPSILAGPPRRAASAVASGPAALLAIPAQVFRDLAAAHPDLLPGLRRVAEDLEAAQQMIVGRAAKNATQHVFRDLYRLQVARSLLVIDLESCVRCGHCAWACSEMYGVARLVRRGDKMVARVDPEPIHAGPGDGAPQHLMLPNSCQHCEHPACMVDCPTGAIGRDPAGEVFIRDELCTGCGACAKACPWDNIQMAIRPAAAARPSAPGGGASAGEYAELAVKCDLCRGYEGPACVQACPTGSIFRLNPAEELADVRDLLRGPTDPAASSRTRADGPPIVAGAAIAAAGIAITGAIMQSREAFRPSIGVGYAAGIAAGLGMLALLAYAVPKRGIRRWMRPRAAQRDAAPVRKPASVVKPQLAIHLAIGLVTVSFAIAHAPWPPTSRSGHGGALALTLLITTLAGAWTAIAYRLIPPRLARLERTAALPEDFARARRELLDRLYREVSGKSDLVKKIVERILLPYTKSALGPLALIASGRRLRDEEAMLRARIDRVLEGRGAERLAGLAELIRLVVELRSLPAQRWLLRALRAGLPLHVVTFGLAMAMLLLHAILATRRPG